ncbi:MAG: archaeal proteasome endopeptidase complex subunit alpha [Nanoarchaeota archaeon]|nr:archaeal proteasome endopeptidase complex subunit alpha [Nanoarchaeota archaeon]MBU0962395.1 archaeal proteasome endopeptidase complex subunit alpha [Nanoarchaeota archaeon]
MQANASQMMGYDRANTMFSPDGRLLQVEYAKKTVKQGSATIGIVCKDGVLLVADKRIIDKFIVPRSIEKVFQVDDHIAAAASGIVSDGRVLVENAQVMSQQHKMTYDEPIQTQELVKDICNIMQKYTQFGGPRPFGVSILFAGVNEEPQLFLTDVTGIYFEYKATAIGEGEEQIKEILEKEYKETITISEGIKLCLRALKKVLGNDFDMKRIDGGYIKTSEKNFVRLDQATLKKTN